MHLGLKPRVDDPRSALPCRNKSDPCRHQIVKCALILGRQRAAIQESGNVLVTKPRRRLIRDLVANDRRRQVSRASLRFGGERRPFGKLKLISDSRPRLVVEQSPRRYCLFFPSL